MSGALAALFAALAVWLAVPGRARAASRLADALRPRPAAQAPGASAPALVTAPGVPPRRARAAAAVVGVAVAVVAGGPLGLAGGLAVAVGLAVVLSRLEPRERRRRRARLAAQACDVADLLGACLASGAAVGPALAAVAAAVGPPAADPLRVLVGRVRLGADTSAAWAALAAEPAFAPVARAVARSEESGAPLADALRRAADDVRAQRRGELLTAARSAGVRAVIPLGVCFLPAFGLLGVVPVVASLVSSLWR